MPFIDQALADAKEDVCVPEGAYDLSIIQAELKTSKKAAERGEEDNMIQVMIRIESPDYPNASTLFHHLMLVKDPDYEYNHLWLRDQKRFLVLFGIPHEGTGFDLDDFPGATAKQVLLKVDQNERGEDTNVLVLPKIDTEADETAAAGRKTAAGRSAGKPTRRR
jgi:Protein of unknown function (DUF669)